MKQRIIFEQGGPIDGDTGERGDSTVVPDGGAVSIKPVIDGERAEESVYNRPGENVRKRTEQLRDVGEQQLYLQDSDMRWIIVGGDASGLSPTPWPEVTTWSKDGGGAGKGTFVISEPMVVQPINTPSGDVQETVTYDFTTPTAGAVEFTPVSTKRAYNLANIIRIVWQAVPPAELSGAVVTNYCDVAVTGDEKHILTISIRDDDLTQLVNLDTALTSIAADLATMGLGYTITGNNAAYIVWTEITGSPYGDDYTMEKNFEREIHRIIPSAFADFFSGGGYLEDGDTLSIWFEDYTNTAGPPPTGRRQCTPSNSNSNVPHTQLFVTSQDTEKIPLAVPLCKRIGDDLVWLDGTVILDGQLGTPRLGENGYTVNRIVNGASTINLAAHTTTSPLTVDPIDVTVASIQTNVDAIVDRLNDKGTLDENETVTGAWTFAPPRSSGTPTADLFSAKVISTLDGIAITGDYDSIFQEFELSAGSVSSDVRGIQNTLTFSGGSANRVVGVRSHVSVQAAGTVTGNIQGSSSSVYAAPGATLGGHVYGAYHLVEMETDLTSSDSIYGGYTQISNQGDLPSGHIYGSVQRVFNSGILTNGSLYGSLVDIDSVGTLTNGLVYGARVELNIEAAASLGSNLHGLSSLVSVASGATIGDDIYGLFSNIENHAGFAGGQDLFGGRVRVENDGATLASGHIYGFQAVVVNSGTLTSGHAFGAYVSMNNFGGTIGGNSYGVYYSRSIGGTITGDVWAFYTGTPDPSYFSGSVNIGSSAHPAGNTAIKLAVAGAFATHSAGYDDVSSGVNLVSQDVGDVGVLAITMTAANLDVSGLSNGEDGQWLVILNVGSNTFTLYPGIGTQEFLLDGVLYIYPNGGALCLCNGSDWNVVSTWGQSGVVGTGSINHATGDTIEGQGRDIIRVTSVATAPNNKLATIDNPQPNQRVLVVNNTVTDIDVNTSGNIGKAGTIPTYEARLFYYVGSTSKWLPLY